MVNRWTIGLLLNTRLWCFAFGRLNPFYLFYFVICIKEENRTLWGQSGESPAWAETPATGTDKETVDTTTSAGNDVWMKKKKCHDMIMQCDAHDALGRTCCHTDAYCDAHAPPLWRCTTGACIMPHCDTHAAPSVTSSPFLRPVFYRHWNKVKRANSTVSLFCPKTIN